MRIFGIVTCVDYSGFLEKSLSIWQAGLDKLVVVTSQEDNRTQQLLDSPEYSQVILHPTNAFWQDGALFNKAAALEEAYITLRTSADEWVLFFDADVIPPTGWRQDIEEIGQLELGCIYGAIRRTEDYRLIRDTELAGFFQLWHRRDPVVQTLPLLGSWHNASGYDSAFATRWPKTNQRCAPISLIHQGNVGRNWCGVGHDSDMGEVFANRRHKGGFLHERLDNIGR